MHRNKLLLVLVDGRMRCARTHRPSASLAKRIEMQTLNPGRGEIPKIIRFFYSRRGAASFNIVLDELDRELERRGLRFMRYADDINIFVASRRAGKRVTASLQGFLEKQLTLVAL